MPAGCARKVEHGDRPALVHGPEVDGVPNLMGAVPAGQEAGGLIGRVVAEVHLLYLGIMEGSVYAQPARGKKREKNCEKAHQNLAPMVKRTEEKSALSGKARSVYIPGSEGSSSEASIALTALFTRAKAAT